jgi:hypothetical protein
MVDFKRIEMCFVTSGRYVIVCSFIETVMDEAFTFARYTVQYSSQYVTAKLYS